MTADFPEKLQPIFEPHRYKVLHGGRGGAKSWNVARALLIMAFQRPLRVLCAREFQNSIKESVHQLLKNQIELLGFAPWFKVTDTEIKGGMHKRSEFIFSGIRNNPTKIKSMEGVNICWVEEAETVSEESWRILIPTIREEGSEIWVSFNPREESDPTYKRFIINTPPDCVRIEMNWRDNPWFPVDLKAEKDYDYSVDPDSADHVWGGQLQRRSADKVLHGKWVVSWFEPQPEWDGPYYGADFGFSQDPATLMRVWIHERKLYVEREFYRVGVEIDHLPTFWMAIQGAERSIIRADNSRPETISYLKRNGFPNVKSSDKWPGCVEDGISFLRSFEQIVIHPDCKHAAEEARLYAHKVDRLTGDVLPDIIDKHNHCWDAIRYAVEPLIKKPNLLFPGM